MVPQADSRTIAFRKCGTGSLQPWSLLLVAGVLVFPPHFVEAAAPKQDAALQQQLRKAQGILRQLNEEKKNLESEKAALQEQVGKLESAVRQLEPLASEVERQKAAVESLKNANAGLETQLASGAERERQLGEKLGQVIGQARQIQGDNQHLVQAVKERELWIDRCRQKNRELAEAQAELIQRYQDKGFWDKLGDVEPITGIGRVKTENFVQDYQFRLEDLTVTPFQSEASGEGTQAPAVQQNSQTVPPGDEDDQISGRRFIE